MASVQIDLGADLHAERNLHALIDDFLETHPLVSGEEQKFLGAQFDAGLAWVHFPVGYGGLNLDRSLGEIISDRFRCAGAPDWLSRNPIGYGMAAPTLVSLGSDDQKLRYLRRLFTCEDVWCQLFSEPSAGSDLAALSTRARRDGDEWVVTGQKVWSTMAHVARYGLLLARTDTEAVKHKGLTYFVVDLFQEGVQVRPLRQLTGDAEFNEVFFDDARVPDAERLTSVGDGWSGAIVTLDNERNAVGGGLATNDIDPIELAIATWRQSDRGPVQQDMLVDLWMQSEVLRLMKLRSHASVKSGGAPAPHGAVLKLVQSLLMQRVFNFCVNTLGPAGQLFGSYEMRQIVPGEPLWDSDDVRWLLLRSMSFTIGGGTSEVMRNILGERVLGLPRDLRVDKETPWSQIARS